MNKKRILQNILVVLLFSIPFFSGAFLYGVLDLDSYLYFPILFVSLFIFYLILGKYSKQIEEIK